MSECIRIDMDRQVKWYLLFLILSDSYPNAGISEIVECVNSELDNDKKMNIDK